MKVVHLVTRNSDQLSLHFFVFYTNLYQFYKFAVFENKRKRKRNLASRPLERFGRLQMGPWLEPGTEEEAAAAFPGEGARRRRGEVGERREGGESYSEGVLSRSGAAGSGVGGEAVARLRRRAAAAPLRRGREGDDRPGSFTAARRS